MTKQEYNKLLLQKEWKEKRKLILERDNFTCRHCGSKECLQVHHKKYLTGLLPWEYDNAYLITLCSKCHANVHHKKERIKKLKEKANIKTKKKKLTEAQKIRKYLSKPRFKKENRYSIRYN